MLKSRVENKSKVILVASKESRDRSGSCILQAINLQTSAEVAVGVPVLQQEGICVNLSCQELRAP